MNQQLLAWSKETEDLLDLLPSLEYMGLNVSNLLDGKNPQDKSNTLQYSQSRNGNPTQRGKKRVDFKNESKIGLASSHESMGDLDPNIYCESHKVIESVMITNQKQKRPASRSFLKTNVLRKRQSVTSYASMDNSSYLTRNESVSCHLPLFRVKSLRKLIHHDSNKSVSLNISNQHDSGTTNTTKHSSLKNSSGAHKKNDTSNTSGNQVAFITNESYIPPTTSLSKNETATRRRSLPAMLSGSNSYKVQDRCGVVAAYDKRASLSYLDCAKLDFERFDDFEKSVLTAFNKNNDEYATSIDSDSIDIMLNTVEEEEEEEEELTLWTQSQQCASTGYKSTKIISDIDNTNSNYLEFIEFNSLVFDQDFLDVSQSQTSAESVMSPQVTSESSNSSIGTITNHVRPEPLSFDIPHLLDFGGTIPQTPTDQIAPVNHLVIHSPMAVCSANAQPPERQHKWITDPNSGSGPFGRVRQKISQLLNPVTEPHMSTGLLVVVNDPNQPKSGRPPYSPSSISTSLTMPAPTTTINTTCNP